MNVVEIAAAAREGAERGLPDVVSKALDEVKAGNPSAVFEDDALAACAKLYRDFPAWTTLREAAKAAGVNMGDLERAVKRQLATATPVPGAVLGGLFGQSTKLDQGGLALRLAPRWHNELAHVRGLGWLDCDDGLWALDEGAVRTGKRVRRAIDGGEAGVAARKGVRTAGVVCELAGELDSPLDKWGAADVLGLPSGRALDLATGQVRRAQPSEHVYQRLAVAPEAGEPSEWLRGLGETFSQLEKPAEMIAYLRWWLRYSLGRSCDDESALFLVGPTGTGKSTLADTWASVVGSELGATRDGNRLVARGGYAQHSQWLAGLAGKRFLRVGELPENGRWDAGPLSTLIAGETVEANRMRENSTEFGATVKVMITGNHQPELSPQSGLVRRLRIVECRCVVARADKRLKARLQGERGRILQWVLDAPAEAPDVPDAVKRATRTYRDEASPLLEWLEACAVVCRANERENYRARPDDLWASYEGYCTDRKIAPLSKRRFELRLTEKFGGTVRRPPATGKRVERFRLGVQLRTGDEER